MTELSKLLNAKNDAWPGGPLTTRKRAELSRKYGRLDFTTVARYQSGRHPARPDELTLIKLADAYDIELSELQCAASVGVGAGPYKPPPEAASLTRKEQAAITALIRAIAAGKTEAPGA